MTPGAHLLSSWLIANSFALGRRERRLVTLAGFIPDLDGIGLVLDQVNHLRHQESFYYESYHHLFGHNLLAGVVIAVVFGLVATRSKIKTMALSLLTFHLHLVCDLVGSKGPDGYRWPIAYLYPFFPKVELSWSGQWELNAWPNTVFLLLALAGAILWSAKQRYSFVEVFSVRLDREIFSAIERRWPARSVP